MGIHGYVLATAIPRITMGANIEKDRLLRGSGPLLTHRRSGEKSTLYGGNKTQSR